MSRFDGRENNQLREIVIKRDFINHAEGSCLIEMGKTKIICTASVDNKNIPFFVRGTGSGWITAEYGMLPRSTHNRNLRDRIQGRNMEIQRLIGRSLRSVVDLKKVGERKIWIDCDVVQADGGTRTASVIGGFVALVDCLNRIHQQGVISEFPVTDFLGAISVGIVKGKYLLDLCYAEDIKAEVDMNVVMKSDGDLVELQGTGEQRPFSRNDLGELLDLAQEGIFKIIDQQRDLFKDLLPNR